MRAVSAGVASAMRSGKRRRLAAGVLTAGLLFVPAAARALPADVPFHHLSITRWHLANGLPLATVTALAQDKTGYLWVGTQNGLARFDGHRFTLFTHERESGLAGNYIHDLHVARDGTLWIATADGLSAYRSGRFVHIPTEEPLLGAVTAVAETPHLGLVVGSDAGLFRVVGGRLQAFGSDNEARRPVRCLLARGDQLWGCTPGGVLYLDANGLHVTRYGQPGGEEGMSVSALAHDGDTLWIGTAAGLLRAAGNGVVPVPRLAAQRIEALALDRDGNLWAATTRGLYRLRDGTVVEEISDETVLYNLWNRSLFEDRAGALWLGGQSGGLVRVAHGAFSTYTPRDGLAHASTWSVVPARDGSLLIGTEGGLDRLQAGRIAHLIEGRRLPSPIVGAVLEDRSGRLWLGTTSGLAVFRDGAPVRLAGLAALPKGRYLALYETSTGDVWVGSAAGAYRLKRGGNRIEPFAALGARAVRDIAEIDGTLWFATEDGVYRLTGETLELVDGAIGGKRFALEVATAAEGGAWIGYVDLGLARWRDGQLTRYTTNEGLPANTILHVAETADGWLWLATLQGVSRVRRAAFESRAEGAAVRLAAQHVLTVTDEAGGGTHHVTYCCHGGTSASGFLAGDGRLYLPSVSGLVVIDTRHPTLDEPPPEPVIERLTAGDRAFVLDGRPLSLPPDRRDVAIAFTAIDLTATRSLRFRYRLTGYSDEWVEAGDRREALYTNLDAGHYVLSVAAGDAEGRWNPRIASVAFEIQPLVTETALFRVLVALLALVLAYGLHRAWSYRIYRQQRLLEATVAQRTMELSLANQRLAEANAKLEQLSLTDELTGVRNRRFLDTQLSKEAARLDRLRERPVQDQALMLVIADLDHFKDVNDRYGHAAGDCVLKELAQLFVRGLRQGDYVVRLGGEEFLLVLHDVDRHVATQLADRLCAAVRAHAFDIGVTHLKLTCSFGFAFYPPRARASDGFQIDDAMTLADRALYYVKHHGRDGWAGVFVRDGTDLEALRARIHERLERLAAEGWVELVTSTRSVQDEGIISLL